MKSSNRPRREPKKTKAEGAAFVEKKRRNKERRKAILRALLNSVGG